MYVHHVPGRLRISHVSFRCAPARAEALVALLDEVAGVRSAAINPKAGSITIHYDPQRQSRAGLLLLLEQYGCLGVDRPASAAGLGTLFGRALMGALAQRTAHSIVGVIL